MTNDCIHSKLLMNNEVVDCYNFISNHEAGGISIYEVFRLMEGTPLFLNEHLERLINSAKIVNLDIKIDNRLIAERIKKLSEINNVANGNVKILYHFAHRNHRDATLFVYFIRHNYPTDAQYRQGVSAAFFHAERYNPNAKIVNKHLREETENMIRDNNIFDVVLLDRNENITEGSRTNVFMIKDREIYTPPIQSVLPGITRQKVFDICRKFQINVIEQTIDISKTRKMEAAFFSGTSPGILPISQLAEIAFDVNNEILRKIMQEYNKIIHLYWEEKPFSN